MSPGAGPGGRAVEAVCSDCSGCAGCAGCVAKGQEAAFDGAGVQVSCVEFGRFMFPCSLVTPPVVLNESVTGSAGGKAYTAPPWMPS